MLEAEKDVAPFVHYCPLTIAACVPTSEAVDN